MVLTRSTCHFSYLHYGRDHLGPEATCVRDLFIDVLTTNNVFFFSTFHDIHGYRPKLD